MVFPQELKFSLERAHSTRMGNIYTVVAFPEHQCHKAYGGLRGQGGGEQARPWRESRVYVGDKGL